jgi:ribonuclease Z
MAKPASFRAVFTVLGLCLGGLIALTLLGLTVFQRQIGEAIFARAVVANVGLDRSALLPDGLHVFVCGSGSPLPDTTRAGPCLGVLAGKRAFVFDTGSGGMRNLARMGFPVGRTEAVFLTHLHSDHIDGMGEALLQAWVGGSRKQPLPIYGPPGTERVVEGFNAVYAIDARYRTAHHGPQIAAPEGFGGAARMITVPKGPGGLAIVLEGVGLTIEAFLVNHSPVEPAYGYRIAYKGRVAVISGDTVYDQGVVRAAKGADILFHDTLQPEMVAQIGRAAAANGDMALAKIMTDIEDYHASPEDAARAAQEAGVGTLVLTHIVPPLPTPILNAAFLGNARQVYKGPLFVARDGQVFSLPADSETVKRSFVRQ